MHRKRYKYCLSFDNLELCSVPTNPPLRELELDITYGSNWADNPRIRIGAEFTPKDKPNSHYDLKIFFKNPTDGARLVSEERPSDIRLLNDLILMHQLLGRMGYIREIPLA